MLYVAHHLSQCLLFLDLFSSYYFVMLYCIFKAFPLRSGYAPGFVNYKKGSLDSHGRWFSPGTPASSTTKAGRHDIAEILLKVALNTINQSIKSFMMINFIYELNER